jgi:hypothetical protein
LSTRCSSTTGDSFSTCDTDLRLVRQAKRHFQKMDQQFAGLRAQIQAEFPNGFDDVAHTNDALTSLCPSLPASGSSEHSGSTEYDGVAPTDTSASFDSSLPHQPASPSSSTPFEAPRSSSTPFKAPRSSSTPFEAPQFSSAPFEAPQASSTHSSLADDSSSFSELSPSWTDVGMTEFVWAPIVGAARNQMLSEQWGVSKPGETPNALVDAYKHISSTVKAAQASSIPLEAPRPSSTRSSFTDESSFSELTLSWTDVGMTEFAWAPMMGAARNQMLSEQWGVTTPGKTFNALLDVYRRVASTARAAQASSTPLDAPQASSTRYSGNEGSQSKDSQRRGRTCTSGFTRSPEATRDVTTTTPPTGPSPVRQEPSSSTSPPSATGTWHSSPDWWTDSDYLKAPEMCRVVRSHVRRCSSARQEPATVSTPVVPGRPRVASWVWKATAATAVTAAAGLTYCVYNWL